MNADAVVNSPAMREHRYHPIEQPAGDPLVPSLDAAEIDACRCEVYQSYENYLRAQLEAIDGARPALWRRDYSSEDAYLHSIQPMRAHLTRMLGFWSDPPERPPLLVADRTRLHSDDSVEAFRFWIEILPGLKTYGLELVPRKRPIVAGLLVQHGYGGTPEAACGLVKSANSADSSYRSMGLRAARRGFHVVAICHPTSFGTLDDITSAPPPQFEHQTHAYGKNRLHRMATMGGGTLFGLDMMASSRGVDLLCQTRSAASRRIGMYGLSQGGQSALYLPAIDTRIQAAVCSAFFNERLRKLMGPHRAMSYLDSHEEDKFFTDVVRCFGDSDLASLIAPRAFAIEAGVLDSSVDFEKAAAEFEKARIHYERLDITNRLEFIAHEQGHVAATSRALDFLEERLCVDRRNDIRVSEPPRRLNFGVIGCGSLAQSQHLPNIARSQRAKLVACCDQSDEALDACRSRFRVTRLSRNFCEVIDDPQIDVICLATTEKLRRPVIERAARAAKPIYVEKPIARTMDDVRAIQAIVRDSGIRLCVGHNRRCSPAMIDARRIFRSHMTDPKPCPWRWDRDSTARPDLPEKGPASLVVRINDDWFSWKPWVFDKEQAPHGPMLFEMTHFTDLCNWFLDDEPLEVLATETGMLHHSVTIRYRGGALATITMCATGSHGYPKERYEAMGNGGIVIVEHMVELRTAGISGAPERKLYPMLNDRHPLVGREGGLEGWLAKKRCACAEAERAGDPSLQFTAEPDKGHAHAIERFIDEIFEVGPPVCPVDDAALATRVAFAAIRSAHERRLVALHEI